MAYNSGKYDNYINLNKLILRLTLAERSGGDDGEAEVPELDKRRLKPEAQLLDLPPTVLERIASYLDPVSLNQFKKSSPVFEVAFPSKIEQKYYRNLCLNTISPDSTIFPKILRSFYTQDQMTGRPVDPLFSDGYNWKAAYFMYFSYEYILKTCEITTNSDIYLPRLVKEFKYSIVNSPEFKGRATNWKDPCQYFTTHGSFMYRFQDPPSNRNLLHRIWTYESMKKCTRIGPVVDADKSTEKILYITLMDLDDFNMKEISMTSVPSLDSVFLILTLWKVVIAPTRGGTPSEIELDRAIHVRFGTSHRKFPPFAFNNKGFLALWIDRTYFHLYKVSLEPVTQNAIVTQLKVIDVGVEMTNLWNNFFINQIEYLSILKTVRGGPGQRVGIPEFHFVSPTRINYSISYPENANLDDDNVQITGIINRIRPSNNNSPHPKGLRLTQYPIQGRTIGHKRVLFWTSRAVHLLIRPSTLWISHEWPNCIIKRTQDPGICGSGKITAVEFVDINSLLVAVNGLIYYFKLFVAYPSERDEDELNYTGFSLNGTDGTHNTGELRFTKLRKFDLTHMLPKTPIHIRMDFWSGHPYIFIRFDNFDEEKRNALSYDLVKIKFLFYKHFSDPEFYEKTFMNQVKEALKKRPYNRALVQNHRRHNEFLYL